VGAAVAIGDWGRNGAAVTILAAGVCVLTGCKNINTITTVSALINIFMNAIP
jgi:TATA-box binding protein (TBP) (component of TFIID and TFIIIB)